MGMSAILSQKTPGTDDQRIVAYVNRSLSATEQKYSQTEKEALAMGNQATTHIIVWWSFHVSHRLQATSIHF